jgi:hypothetical protein
VSAEPVGGPEDRIRPLRISGELARELLRVLREEDPELPEDSTVLALLVERRPAPPPVQPERTEDGIDGLIGVLGDLDVPADASERVDEYVYRRR